MSREMLLQGVFELCLLFPVQGGYFSKFLFAIVFLLDKPPGPECGVGFDNLVVHSFRQYAAKVCFQVPNRAAAQAILQFAVDKVLHILSGYFVNFHISEKRENVLVECALVALLR